MPWLVNPEKATPELELADSKGWFDEEGEAENALPSGLLQLPPEVLELIVAALPHLPRAPSSFPAEQQRRHVLLNLSLTSTVFRNLAQRLLYAAVSLDSLAVAREFVHAVRQDASLGGLVREVVLGLELEQVEPGKVDQEKFVKWILRACPNLEALVVVGPQVPVDTLNHQSLRSLVVSGSDFVSSRTVPPSLPSLSHLSITSSSIKSSVLSNLLDPLSLPSLTHLSLHNLATGPQLDASLPSFLSALAAASLRFLSVDVSFASHNTLDLSPLPSDPPPPSTTTTKPPVEILFDASSSAPVVLLADLTSSVQFIHPPIKHLAIHSLANTDIPELKRILPRLGWVYVSIEEARGSAKLVEAERFSKLALGTGRRRWNSTRASPTFHNKSAIPPPSQIRSLWLSVVAKGVDPVTPRGASFGEFPSSIIFGSAHHLFETLPPSGSSQSPATSLPEVNPL